MQGKASPGSDRACDPLPLESKDADVQRAVLALSLAEHPKPLTIPDLAREIDEGDAVERAVRDLVGVGLLICSGLTIQPSAPALYFERLELP